jgi:predicted nucleic acid-binding Zn ribbon protein/hydrogenase maturation factor
MMDFSIYEIGEWIPQIGAYKHECFLCNEPFVGRKNKKYCSEKCKSHFNNHKAQRINHQVKEEVTRLKKSQLIFGRICKVPGKVYTVTKSQLIELGYNKSVPTRIIKDDDFHGDWNLVGGYAYKIIENGNKFEIRKL